MKKIDLELCDYKYSSVEEAYSCLTQVMLRLEAENKLSDVVALKKSILMDSLEVTKVQGFSVDTSMPEFVSNKLDDDFLIKVAQKLSANVGFAKYKSVLVWYLACKGLKAAQDNLIKSFRDVLSGETYLNAADKRYSDMVAEWIAVVMVNITHGTMDSIEAEVDSYFKEGILKMLL